MMRFSYGKTTWTKSLKASSLVLCATLYFTLKHTNSLRSSAVPVTIDFTQTAYSNGFDHLGKANAFCVSRTGEEPVSGRLAVSTTIGVISFSAPNFPFAIDHLSMRLKVLERHHLWRCAW